MYLSRAELDVQNRSTIRALNSPNIFHGAIESSFSGNRRRNLWRIDSLGGQLYMLIVSEDKPQLQAFCNQFGYENSSWETRCYNDFLDKIECGSVWRFRITANPTRSKTQKEYGQRGKVQAHITTEAQKKWLISKAEKNGFTLNETLFDVVEHKWFRFYKAENKKISLLSVSYEGILKVSDAELFKAALINGIGREKAYGMGMLTIIHM